MKKEKSVKEKFQEIASKEQSKFLEQAEWRIKNKEWLKKSFNIAVEILRILREKGISQKEFAEMMNVTPQQISKIVKGKENFTIETISKLEKVLERNLISISEVKPSVEIFSSIEFKSSLAYKPNSISPEYKNNEFKKSNLTESKTYDKNTEQSFSVEKSAA